MATRTRTPPRTSTPIAPGAWLGLLGGGQLGRMFCMAAQSLGYRVAVLDPGDHSPAGSVADRHIRADYLDPPALDTRVAPAAASVAIAQDRISEKTFLSGHGFGVAPFAVLRSAQDARDADPA